MSVEKTTRWTPEEMIAIRREQRRYESPPPKPEPEWSWMDHLCPDYEYCQDCVDQAEDETAAVIFGLLGMATAIRERYAASSPGGAGSVSGTSS